MDISDVLIIDDDPAIRRVVQITLCSVGKWNVKTAESGLSGLRILADGFRPDVIILDVMMAGLDGPATYSRIRQTKYGALMPVILMTAKVQKQDMENYYKSGVAGVIPKPFDPMTLPSEIRKMCQGWMNAVSIA